MSKATEFCIPVLEEASYGKTIGETLGFLYEYFEGSMAFSSSFGLEDQVVTHIILESKIPVRIFTLDTGRMFQETYQVFSRTLERYKTNIEVYFPNAEQVEKMMREKGPNSFYYSIENRKECCHIRKVEPLKRALQNVSCWITGLRAEQSDARKELPRFQWDQNFQLIKYNPLHDWTFDQVKQFVSKHTIPYNSLHDKGFVSIGCAPCTRTIEPGQEFRAGRWWWESGSQKECGLHAK